MLLTPEHLDGLPLARYTVQLVAQTTATLPLYLGSTLRGAFGAALKKLACTIAHQNCAVCLLRTSCSYPTLFEPQPNPNAPLNSGQDAPRPFIFVPPLPPDLTPTPTDAWLRQHRTLTAGQTLTFEVLLLGPSALAAVPYFVAACQQMAQHGLGVDRSRFRLAQVAVQPLDGSTQIIYTPHHNHVRPHEAARFTLGDWTRSRLAQFIAPHALTLEFVTPTRLRVRGQLMATPDFALIIKSLSLRLALLAATHGATPLVYDYRTLVRDAAQVEVDASQLYWRELERRTNRRHTTMDLDGFMGVLQVRGAKWEQFLPLLVAGEAVHVGNNTAFGLGRYRLITRASVRRGRSFLCLKSHAIWLAYSGQQA